MGETIVVMALGAVLGAALAASYVRARARSHVRSGVWDGLLAEFERARRYEHRFAVARLSLDDASGALASLPLGRGSVRSTDHTFVMGRHVYVVLPEAERESAERWLTRLRRSRPDLDGGSIRVACFPDDGVTTGEVLGALQEKPDRRTPVTADARWAS